MLTYQVIGLPLGQAPHHVTTSATLITLSYGNTRSREDEVSQLKATIVHCGQSTLHS